jgi:hypothetical protein
MKSDAKRAALQVAERADCIAARIFLISKKLDARAAKHAPDMAKTTMLPPGASAAKHARAPSAAKTSLLPPAETADVLAEWTE